MKGKIVFVGGRKVTLTPNDFVAQGGEGSVYAQGETAFKIFADPARALLPSKLAELRRISDPEVFSPEALVTEGGRVVGHTVRFLRAAHALGELFPRAFKQRMGLGPARVADLVARLAERVRNIHLAGALVVDLSELNFLVDVTLSRIVAIDVDSYQTANHPATAITPAIRDPLARHGFSEGSDWFSFAVVSFQLFVGLHPYRGRHPSLKRLSERMRRHACAGFDPAVRMPPVALGLDVIPDGWRAWYRAVLAEGKRLPPPVVMEAPHVCARASAAPTASLSRALLFEVGEPIRQIVAGGGAVWALTDRALYRDGVEVAAAPAGCSLAVSSTGRPVLAWIADGKLWLVDALAGRRLASDLAADAVMAVRGDLYAKCAARVVEIRLHDVGSAVIAAPRTATLVLPHATTLFDGVVVQRLRGATYLAVFPARGRCLVARVATEEGRVVGGRADGTVAMLLVARPHGIERVVVRLAETGHDVRLDPSEGAGGLRFACLDRGICVSADDDGAVEIFAAAPGATARRALPDARLGADHLIAGADGVLCAEGHRVYRITTRDGQATQASGRAHAG